MNATGQRILVVSNRGPFEHLVNEGGEIVAVPGEGGVATAVRAAATYRASTWLSSPIPPVDRLRAGLPPRAEKGNTASRYVVTDGDAYRAFYEGFSNEVLWFLQHEMAWPDGQTEEQRVADWEDGYLPVNQAFAEAIVDELDADEYDGVMLHDYHFYAAALFVRNLRPDVYLQQFTHIPWPEPAEWGRLDAGMVVSICRGLLANDSLLFQTPASAANFLATCAAYLPDVEVDFTCGLVDAGPRQTR